MITAKIRAWGPLTVLFLRHPRYAYSARRSRTASSKSSRAHSVCGEPQRLKDDWIMKPCSGRFAARSPAKATKGPCFIDLAMRERRHQHHVWEEASCCDSILWRTRRDLIDMHFPPPHYVFIHILHAFLALVTSSTFSVFCFLLDSRSIE